MDNNEILHKGWFSLFTTVDKLGNTDDYIGLPVRFNNDIIGHIVKAVEIDNKYELTVNIICNEYIDLNNIFIKTMPSISMEISHKYL